MSEILQSVGNRIREIRKQKSLSQDQLGEKSGFHFSYIGGLERGERNISLANLAKIADSLGVSLSELLTFDTDIPAEKQAFIQEIVHLLYQRDEPEIKMAKTILSEIFSTYSKRQQ